MPRPIIIDTDPGQDDAVAILLALASPELDVLGITTVAGNVPLSLTTKNALKVCELAGRSDTKVYQGAAKPLLRPLETAEYVHGASGLDGPDLPDPKMTIQDQHAVDFIIETCLSQDVTLCALGPLTNLGIALSRAPEIASNIKEIVLMGGGLFEGGNVTPAAEFNIYVDPHAADIVFRSGVEIVVMPLDLTHTTLTSRKRVEAFRSIGTKPAVATAELLDFFERYDIKKYGTDGGPLHDPNVIAYLLKPELYEGRHIHLAVETSSELTMGMTVADWWGKMEKEPNCTYMRYVDDEGFFELLTDRIATL